MKVSSPTILRGHKPFPTSTDTTDTLLHLPTVEAAKAALAAHDLLIILFAGQGDNFDVLQGAFSDKTEWKMDLAVFHHEMGPEEELPT